MSCSLIKQKDEQRSDLILIQAKEMSQHEVMTGMETPYFFINQDKIRNGNLSPHKPPFKADQYCLTGYHPLLRLSPKVQSEPNASQNLLWNQVCPHLCFKVRSYLRFQII